MSYQQRKQVPQQHRDSGLTQEGSAQPCHCPPLSNHGEPQAAPRILNPSAKGYPPQPLGDSRHLGFPANPTRDSSADDGHEPSKARPYPGPQTREEEGVPTLRPCTNFNASQDAEDLRKAMKGLGTDETAIINVLAQRSADQRMDILRAYKAKFGKDLIKDFKSELSGNFEKLVLAMMFPRFEYLAKEVFEAVDGVGTNEAALIEVLVPSSNYEISQIAAAYQRMYGKNMEQHVVSDISGSFKKLLVPIFQGLRDERSVDDMELARNDAQNLYNARRGHGRMVTDSAVFIHIFTTRSFEHLRQVQTEYFKLHSHSLEKAVKREFYGDIEKGLTATLMAARSKAEYFAYRIRKSVKGVGTNDRFLIRSVVSRCEVDLATVADYYLKLYGEAMIDDISGDTSGEYRKLLLALCGH